MKASSLLKKRNYGYCVEKSWPYFAAACRAIGGGFQIGPRFANVKNHIGTAPKLEAVLKKRTSCHK